VCVDLLILHAITLVEAPILYPPRAGCKAAADARCLTCGDCQNRIQTWHLADASTIATPQETGGMLRARPLASVIPSRHRGQRTCNACHYGCRPLALAVGSMPPLRSIVPIKTRESCPTCGGVRGFRPVPLMSIE
jgi:hypothetical protein